MNVYRRMFGFVAAAAAVVVMLVASAAHAWAGDTTCSGGTPASPVSIAPGVYSRLQIAGVCAVNAGSVTVTGNLTVLPGASLVAYYGGVGEVPISPNLTVGGNLDVQSGGLLVLGCEPLQYTCVNDPAFPLNQPGTYSTLDTIGGNLTADNAAAVVVHHSVIGGNVSLSGGGSGVNSCTEFMPLLGAPPYGDFEDDYIGGNLSIKNWLSCWLGVFRNTVANNADLTGNITTVLQFPGGPPDGNEIGSNTILGNFSCSGNSPSPQIGDSGAGPTTVVGNASGQCVVQPGLIQH